MRGAGCLLEPSGRMLGQEEIAEARIREAFEAGEFDDLPGMGRPLDLEGYFATPSSWRMGFSVLRSAGVVPEEVELRREISRLQALQERLTEERERAAVARRIAELEAVYDLKMRKYRGR